jgi:hypothetical protein
VGNVNARHIIPFAVAAWLAFIAVFATDAPGVLKAAVVVAFALAVPLLVLFLFGEAGWRRLASRYRARERFSGNWDLAPTGQIALVSVDDPAFDKVKARFLSTLRVGRDFEALHLSTLGSGLPLLSFFFPELRVPWAAVRSARRFEAPGWVRPPSEPGALVNLQYDPNYTGTFVELLIGDPPVYVQLPEALLGPEVAATVGLPPELAANAGGDQG